MAKEYLEREPLRTHIESFTGMFTDNDFLVSLDAVLAAIDHAKTVEVAPVRHGHWIKFHLLGCEPHYECSECTSIDNQDYDYCHNCGARMDGEVVVDG